MKQINEQINPNFMRQTQKLLQFTKLLHAVTPLECHNHIKVANIRNQTLMLITNSPVWTTRLRQLSPQILEFVQKNMPALEANGTPSEKIHHLQINTRYQATNENASSKPKTNRPKLKISQKAAELLSQSANSFDDEKLKTALLKMARHATAHAAEDIPDLTKK